MDKQGSYMNNSGPWWVVFVAVVLFTILALVVGSNGGINFAVGIMTVVAIVFIIIFGIALG